MGGRIAESMGVNPLWLRLDLSAPLMSFGAVAVDQIGPTQRWPGLSMLTGLIGNALGWDWTDRESLDKLQSRLVVASALVNEGDLIVDTQNAKLGKNDRGWTTRGMPDGRTGASYDAPHRRKRDYLADADILAVMTLKPADSSPTLLDVRDALLRPARPLFIGRKSCLPARFLIDERNPFIEAPDAYEALRMAVSRAGVRAWWPDQDGPVAERTVESFDLRNWDSGLHGGARRVREGRT